MTKQELFKEYKSMFGSIIATDGIYSIKTEVVKSKFEEFYNKLSKTIKVGNLSGCGITVKEKKEDSTSIGLDAELYLYAEEGMIFSSSIRFFIVKTNNHVEWILAKDNKFHYLPSSL